MVHSAVGFAGSIEPIGGRRDQENLWDERRAPAVGGGNILNYRRSCLTRRPSPAAGNRAGNADNLKEN
jgi:hypothetical protein